MLYKRHVVSFRGLCVIFWRFIKWQLLFCTLIKFVCQYFSWQVKLGYESPNIKLQAFKRFAEQNSVFLFLLWKQTLSMQSMVIMSLNYRILIIYQYVSTVIKTWCAQTISVIHPVKVARDVSPVVVCTLING